MKQSIYLRQFGLDMCPQRAWVVRGFFSYFASLAPSNWGRFFGTEVTI